MLAECIVAVGTMAIPFGIVLLVTIKDFPLNVAIALIVFGIISLVVGLIIAVKQEVASSRREKRLIKRDNLMRRLDKANFITQMHIADKLGVDMSKIEKELRGKLSKNLEQELEDLENEL